jgi:hypothetical protein
MTRVGRVTRLFPSARRWRRLLLGVGLITLGVIGNLVVYSAGRQTYSVIQLAVDVPAGSALSSADLVDVDLVIDPAVPLVPLSEVQSVIGQYAATRLVAGALLTRSMIQPEPLLTPGYAVVAIRVEESGIPAGLEPQSSVDLIIGSAASPTDARVIAASVVEIGAADITGRLSVSVEVPIADSVPLVLADRVGIVLRPADWSVER